MTSPLSNELFHEVHRGLRVKDGLDKSALGVHWSTEHDVAFRFATNNKAFPKSNEEAKRGKILHGEMPMSSVETDTKQLRNRGYGSFIGPNRLDEEEVMAKEGAPIRLTGVTNLRLSKDQSMVKGRTRRYKQPREMKA